MYFETIILPSAKRRGLVLVLNDASIRSRHCVKVCLAIGNGFSTASLCNKSISYMYNYCLLCAGVKSPLSPLRFRWQCLSLYYCCALNIFPICSCYMINSFDGSPFCRYCNSDSRVNRKILPRFSSFHKLIVNVCAFFKQNHPAGAMMWRSVEFCSLIPYCQRRTNQKPQKAKYTKCLEGELTRI